MNGHGLVSRLLLQLPHWNAPGSARRHLFLMTTECYRCLFQICRFCSWWHRSNGSNAVQLSLTLGPGNKRPSADRQGRNSGAHLPHFIVVPPNIMERSVHPRWMVPLCGQMTSAVVSLRPASGQRQGAGVVACRPNTANRELLIFFQARCMYGRPPPCSGSLVLAGVCMAMGCSTTERNAAGCSERQYLVTSTVRKASVFASTTN